MNWIAMKRIRGVVACICLAGAVVVPGTPAAAGSELAYRARIGNNTEALTFVNNGPLAGSVVVMDGYDVIAIPVSRPGSAQEVFELDPDDVGRFSPRGIAHVPTQRRFYYAGLDPDQLFVTDQKGNVLPALEIIRPAEHDEVAQYEGLAYIPPQAPAHPNTIAALVLSAETGLSQIDYIALDGTVVETVLPQPASPVETYLTGLAYQHPGRLLAGRSDVGEVYAMELSGALVSVEPFTSLPEAFDIEGIAVDARGRVYEADYALGNLFAFDGEGGRLPGNDRSFVIGLGLSTDKVVWDFDAARFVFTAVSTIAGVFGTSLATAPHDVSTADKVTDIDSAAIPVTLGLGYAGAGEAAVTAAFVDRGVGLFDLADGTLTTRLVFRDEDGFPFATWNPSAVAPLGDDLAVRAIRNPTLVHVVTRTGTPDSVNPAWTVPEKRYDIRLDQPGNGRGLAIFDAGNGLELFTGGSFYDLIADTNGNYTTGVQTSLVDLEALGVVTASSGTYITSGPWAGRFAVMDLQTSTFVVFSR